MSEFQQIPKTTYVLFSQDEALLVAVILTTLVLWGKGGSSVTIL